MRLRAVRAYADSPRSPLAYVASDSQSRARTCHGSATPGMRGCPTRSCRLEPSRRGLRPRRGMDPLRRREPLPARRGFRDLATPHFCRPPSSTMTPRATRSSGTPLSSASACPADAFDPLMRAVADDEDRAIFTNTTVDPMWTLPTAAARRHSVARRFVTGSVRGTSPGYLTTLLVSDHHHGWHSRQRAALR